MTAPAVGRRLGGGPVLPVPPSDAEKASYAWRSLPFLTGALTMSALCVVTAQAWLEVKYPVAAPFAVYTLAYLCYQALSIPVNFTGRNFDMEEHQLTVMAWRPCSGARSRRSARSPRTRS